MFAAFLADSCTKECDYIDNKVNFATYNNNNVFLPYITTIVSVTHSPIRLTQAHAKLFIYIWSSLECSLCAREP